MRKITDFELVDLGIENSQCFQGFGTSFTSFEYCTYGIGDNPREALDDCLEQMATMGFDDPDLESRICESEGIKSLDEFPSSPSVSDEMDGDGDGDGDESADIYYHYGIRWNAKPEEPSAPESALDAWTIAKRFNCDYTGDANPIDHDGTFYDFRDWQAHGYASCVRFTRIADDGDALTVECATINKPADMSSAFACCDVPIEERDNVHAQIQACLGYMGAETLEDFSGPYVMRFAPDSDGNIDEDKVWNSVRAWIANLGS